MDKTHIINAFKIVKVIFLSLLLVSCGRAATTSDETKISSPTLTPSAQLTLVNVNPEITPSANSDVYDSRILFEVKIKDSLCRKLDEPFQLDLIFTNLTDNPLNLADQFKIARGRHGNGGNIIPHLSLNGKEIYTIWDNSMLNIPLPAVDTYLLIAPSQAFNKTIDFYFPKDLLELWPAKPEIIVTPSPGKYMMTFSFYHADQSVTNWSGIIKSNQIDICIA